MERFTQRFGVTQGGPTLELSPDGSDKSDLEANTNQSIAGRRRHRAVSAMLVHIGLIEVTEATTDAAVIKKSTNTTCTEPRSSMSPF
jgi:hypothetical protein